MTKKYDGALGELKKIIDNNKLTDDHPLKALYQYITEIKIEKIIKDNIRKILLDHIDLIEKYEYPKMTTKDLSNLPWFNDLYYDFFAQDINNFDEIKKIKYDNQIFEQIVNEIFEEVYPTSRKNENIRITKTLETRILNECYQVLSSFKYCGQEVITIDNKINNKLIKEIYEKFDEATFKSINLIISLERKERKENIKREKLCNTLENSKDYINKKIIETLEQYIITKDNKIFEKLNKYPELFQKMQKENIIRKEKKYFISITSDKLRELKQYFFKEEELCIFELLNERCRLEDAINKISNPVNVNYDIDETIERKIIEYIEEEDFCHTDYSKVEESVEIVYRKIIKEVKEKLTETMKAISNIQNEKNLYKTEILVELEKNPENNIFILYQSTPENITSPKDAIYLLYVISEIRNSKIEDELNEFVEDNNYVNFEHKQMNFLENITKEKIKTRLKENNNQKQKTLGGNND